MNCSDRDAILRFVDQQRIVEVLHFTTNRGLVGIFAAREVLCRDDLPKNQHIEYVYINNCENRLKDAAWTGYINMSISRVNQRMLDSSNRWHANDNVWWMVLAFDAGIIAHDGVYFATTNNTYSSCVRRAPGIGGLHALFAQSVEWGYRGSRMSRYDGMPDAYTTDVQAEVLYPRKLSIEHLQAIYVREPEHADWAIGLMRLLPFVPEVPVQLKPEVFQ